MSLLRPPISNYENHFDREKLNLSWNTALWISLIFFVLSVYRTIIGNANLFPVLTGFGVGLSALILIKLTKKFTPISWLILIAATVICQLDLFVIKNSEQIVHMVWIIATAVFIFYTLNWKWGIAFLTTNLVGLFIKISITTRPEAIELIDRNISARFDLYLNLFLASFMICYQVIKIIQSSQKAEQNSKLAREKLMEQNQIVQSQNEEKTVMLKEIHHRVKNNLQVITSLLRLQSREIKDVAAVEHFREAMNRVMAMALIHDKLYQSEDLSKIKMQSYLQHLSNDLITSYSIEIPVTVEIESEVEYLVPKSLVSVALLFNELISNTLKHGLQGQDEGEICIKINMVSAKQIEMHYSDNGNWKTPDREDSFGLELIETLTNQLIGTFERDTRNGTRYHFVFEIEE